MKSSLTLWLVLLALAASATAYWAVRRPQAKAPETAAAPVASEVVQAAPSNPWPAVSTDSNAAAADLAKPAPAVAPQKRFTFDWAHVESTDYKQYVANLRALGFPEELIREIVKADLDELYSTRELPLLPKVVPHDAPLSDRQGKLTDAESNRITQLRAVEMEKQKALEEILGIYVPREVLRTPTSRNYEAAEYALEQLPPEKRDAVQTALEDFWLADDASKGLDRIAYAQNYKTLRDSWAATVSQVLTPEEFEQFQMDTMPQGHELARNTIGMDPTPEEFKAMFQATSNYWADTGGVYGLWRALPVPQDQIAAADQQYKADLQQALGPDRYMDYQMATSDTGRQLHNLAERYDLPRDTVVQAFQLQTEADQVAKTISQFSSANAPGNWGSGTAAGTPPPNAVSPPAELTTRLADLQGQLQEVLGATVWQAWQDGRGQHPSLQP